MKCLQQTFNKNVALCLLLCFQQYVHMQDSARNLDQGPEKSEKL